MGPVARQATETAVQPLFLVKGDTNTNHDPVATAAVAVAPGPVTWVGMNVTGRLHMPWAELDAQAAHFEVAAFVRDITADYHLYCTTTYQADTPIYTCHDSVAAGVLLDPAVVRSAVELTGRVHRGDDRRASLWGHNTVEGPKHRFITDLDYSTIRQRITATFGGSAPR
jgi:purine nucleosidase